MMVMVVVVYIGKMIHELDFKVRKVGRLCCLAGRTNMTFLI